MKRLFISGLVFALAALLSMGSALAAGKTPTVIMVTDTGGLGDKGFNDGGWAGVQLAKQKLGVNTSLIESLQQTDYIPNLTAAAQRAEVVIALGFLMQDAVSQVAKRFPNTKFVLVDAVGEDLPNLASIQIRAGESAFLAGILAAATSKTGTVGFLEPVSIPPVLAYTAGLWAGVKAWNAVSGANVQFLVKSAGTFTDPARGKSLALSMIGQGADIILAGGNTGLGVFQAVKEKNAAAGVTPEQAKAGKRPPYFVIGADLDQDAIVEGQVLTSALKNIPQAVYKAIESAIKGPWKGGVIALGYKDGATGITDLRYTKQFIPARALRLVEKAEALLEAGHPGLDFPLALTNAKEFVDGFKVPSELLQVK